MDLYSVVSVGLVVVFCLGFLVGHFAREIMLAFLKRGARKDDPKSRPFKLRAIAGTPKQLWRPQVVGDAPTQLRHVMAATFSKRKVMSKNEYRVFRAIEEEVRGRPGGFRVLAQTSLGEILATEDKLAFGSINSKRVDCLVIDPYGSPVAAVEYQGDTHHQGTAAARDAVKREALRKAGVHFVEIDASHSPEEIKQFIRRLIFASGREATPPPSSRPSDSGREP